MLVSIVQTPHGVDNKNPGTPQRRHPDGELSMTPGLGIPWAVSLGVCTFFGSPLSCGGASVVDTLMMWFTFVVKTEPATCTGDLRGQSQALVSPPSLSLYPPDIRKLTKVALKQLRDAIRPSDSYLQHFLNRELLSNTPQQPYSRSDVRWPAQTGNPLHTC